MIGVYVILNIVTRDFYIGSSRQVETRLYGHRWGLEHSDHHNPYLLNAWKKYGGDSFIFELIEECEDDILLDREQYYIDAWQPAYNLNKIAGRPPGTLGTTRSSEAIERTRQKHLGRKHPPRTPEMIEAMRERLRGRTQSTESNEKRSRTLQGRLASDEKKENLRRAWEVRREKYGKSGRN